MRVASSEVFDFRCSKYMAGMGHCSTCDFAAVSIESLSRGSVLTSEVPMIIKGATQNWSALTKWSEANFFKHYGDEIFHLHDTYNETVSELLKPGYYKMGHVLPRKHCYADPWRPYTPLLMGSLRADYHIPTQFLPMSTFQIGVGRGRGVGVPPEDHPSSWFAMVAGRKRWVVHPPSRLEPPHLITRPSCEVDRGRFDPHTLVCDQEEGDILWLPSYWWHETCGLQDYSIGMGGLTYQESEHDEGGDPAECLPNEIEAKVYAIDDIEFCRQNACSTLPY